MKNRYKLKDKNILFFLNFKKMDNNSKDKIIIMEEVLIENNQGENNIFENLCNLQKIIKKESSLIKLCKKHLIYNLNLS